MSQAVRGFGLRECRYVGFDKVHLQHILTATAMNLVCLGAWFEGVPLAKTRVSSFAKLAPPLL
ncbi:MAG: transposase [Xenococcus sp. (in: cyanobacteria)]